MFLPGEQRFEVRQCDPGWRSHRSDDGFLQVALPGHHSAGAQDDQAAVPNRLDGLLQALDADHRLAFPLDMAGR